MSRILFLLGSFISLLFAPPQWKAEKFLRLQKDEFYLLNFKVNETQKTLYFRWTLLKNKGLVMHLNYDYFPHQFILYQDYQRNCYTLPLFKAEQKYYTLEPFFMLCFKDYHRGEKIATLKYYIYEGGRDFNIIDERIVPNGGFGAN
ncbi:hypothetical protein LS72_000845 [Helicobacter apodemus]|uniref:Exporting protein n=1 Tax=Helicobacter apodemus TaxID=135569 RepID=A0A4V6I6T2_9HELI|nr:hypothetical protein [Helicobacter apodemus]TLE16965.1 hypothetical protein LS72_000845 [Helicobacter apodemus]